MKYILITLIAFLSTGLGITQNTDHTQEKTILQKLLDDEKHIGVAAGYHQMEGENWTGSLGFADQDAGIGFTPDTRTRIASITKPMTAIAIMQVVEAGLLDLDAPIQHYVPQFPVKKEGDITARMLLSHTSGIDGYGSPREAENTTNYPTMVDAMNVFAERDLKFKPGTDFLYTTYGYVVLGAIIEAVSGQDYESYMQQHIWDKAGMQDTGVEHAAEPQPGQSVLYHLRKKKARQAKVNDLSNRIPGGGMYSTLNDLLKFGQAVLDHTFLKESTFQTMNDMSFERKEGNSYGLGWFLYGPKGKEYAVIGHGGGQTGANTQIMIDLDSRITVVVLSNTSGTGNSVILALVELLNLGRGQN